MNSKEIKHILTQIKIKFRRKIQHHRIDSEKIRKFENAELQMHLAKKAEKRGLEILLIK